MRLREASVLAIGVIVAATVFGLFFYFARTPTETLRVVGGASQRFTADTLKWSVTLTRVAGGASPSPGYAALRQDAVALLAALDDRDVPDSAVRVQPPTSNPMYGREGAISGYRVQQSVQVVTSELDAVEELALDPGQFLSEQMILERSQLEYFYSEIDTLKHELLEKATEDARERAQRIAQAAGVRVGAVREARAGVFQIREPYSTDVSGYGVYNTASRDKEISVTVHAAFTAED
jgi:hypothetical protein